MHYSESHGKPLQNLCEVLKTPLFLCKVMTFILFYSREIAFRVHVYTRANRNVSFTLKIESFTLSTKVNELLRKSSQENFATQENFTTNTFFYNSYVLERIVLAFHRSTLWIVNSGFKLVSSHVVHNPLH